MPKLLSQVNFANLTVASLTTTSTSEVPLDVFSKETFRSVKYQIQITQGSDYETVDFLVVHSGSNTYNLSIVDVKTGDTPLASFDTDISGDNVRLLVTPASSSSTTFKAIRTSINT